MAQPLQFRLSAGRRPRYTFCRCRGLRDCSCKSEPDDRGVQCMAKRDSKEIPSHAAAELVPLVHEVLCGLPDATICIDTAGQITTLNHAAELLFGYDEDELLGRPVSCLLAEPFHGAELVVLQHYFEQAERLPGKKREILGRTKDGRIFPVEVGLRAMRLQNRTYYCASVRDLTEVLAREDQRIQSQKLEAIGRLTSGIAHDFNNLLMGIMGCAHIALSRIDEGSTAHRFVNEIVEAVKRGATLPAQLLAFGQRRDAEQKRIDVAQVFESMSEIFDRTIGEQIHYAGHKVEPGLFVSMGVGQLEQILMNLVLNARDAMPRGGKLELSAKRKPVDENLAMQLQIAAGEYACIEVHDTGCGIEEADRTRVFEPYFTTKDGGRGLGLSAVYGLVRGVGGHISALPAAPHGTCIRLLLPTQDPSNDSDAKSANSRAASAKQRLKILVAEDAELVRMAIVHSLEHAGYDVIEARDGEEALWLGEQTPTLDLLLTDLMLPYRNGIDLERALKVRHPQLRTVLITAYAQFDVQSILQGRESNFPIVLQKPFDDTELLSALAHIRGIAPLPESERVFAPQTWTSPSSMRPLDDASDANALEIRMFTSTPAAARERAPRL